MGRPVQIASWPGTAQAGDRLVELGLLTAGQKPESRPRATVGTPPVSFITEAGRASLREVILMQPASNRNTVEHPSLLLDVVRDTVK
jgi:hypothetical protein